MSDYYVRKYSPSGVFLGTITGCGKNKHTLDSAHSRSAAYRHAAELRKDDTINKYRVETLGD